jgi:alkylation response protein AidB-like acyl-CoA dehydrogenase
MALLTEEQAMLRDSARGWVQTNSPVGAFRKLRDSDNPLCFDAGTFKSIAEMGWTGVVIPEAYGGSEFGYRSIGVVLEELGRKVVAAPLIGSAVGAASALILGGSDAQKKAWLPKIAEGTAIAALAIDEGPKYAPEKIALAATKKGSGYSLSGAKTFVMEGMAANVFVVAARTSGKAGDEKGITLFLVPADAKGISRKRRSLIDSRGYADLTFKDV